VLAITNRLSRPQLVLAGVAGGFVWGVLARLWMRLISTDPEFTWGGTIFILTVTTLFGLGVGGAVAGRRSSRRWVRRVTRVLGAMSLVFLSMAAGMILVASVVPATLALTERRWWKPVRVALLALSLLPAKVVVDGLAEDFSGLKAAIALVAVDLDRLTVVHGRCETRRHRAAIEPLQSPPFDCGPCEVRVDGHTRHETTGEAVLPRDRVLVDLVLRLHRVVLGHE
jgi:hypothetical protein